MSYNNILDKQSHKLASRSGNPLDIMGDYVPGSLDVQPTITWKDRSWWYGFMNPNASINENKLSEHLNGLSSSKRDQILKYGLEKGYINSTQNQSLLDSWNKANPQTTSPSGLDITNNVFSSLGQLTSIGTGIANTVLGYKQFAENQKTMEKYRSLVDEQITASSEARQQRKDEIARLKRVRSNTNQRFNSNAIVSRSY